MIWLCIFLFAFVFVTSRAGEEIIPQWGRDLKAMAFRNQLGPSTEARV